LHDAQISLKLVVEQVDQRQSIVDRARPGADASLPAVIVRAIRSTIAIDLKPIGLPKRPPGSPGHGFRRDNGVTFDQCDVCGPWTGQDARSGKSRLAYPIFSAFSAIYRNEYGKILIYCRLFLESAM
jgi:hypothetical protein